MRLGDPKKRTVYASGGVDIAGSDFDRAIIEKRMLSYFGYGSVKYHPEIMEMIQAIPDWMALPYLGTPINKNILEKAIQAGTAPIQIKALLHLIYNDLAFTFYNRVEAGKIALSSDGATIISLEDKDIALWELYTRHQLESDIDHYLVDVEKVLMETIALSGLEPGEIDAVVKTGGSSNIPLFTGMLEKIFGKEKVTQSSAFTSVVAGLAIKAFNHSAGAE
jgi:hypothetical chaperone protein